MSANLYGDLTDAIFDIARTHADALREVHDYTKHELAVLKARIGILQQQINELQRENTLLRRGAVPAGGGDSR